jgi:hypothetical protein
MAIAVTYDFRDPVARYDRAMRLLPELADQPGRRAHVCTLTADGFEVVEVWETEAAYEHFLRIFRAVMAEVGLTCEPRVTAVHHFM